MNMIFDLYNILDLFPQNDDLKSINPKIIFSLVGNVHRNNDAKELIINLYRFFSELFSYSIKIKINSNSENYIKNILDRLIEKKIHIRCPNQELTKLKLIEVRKFY